MLILFDNGTPRTLARFLIDHHAVTEARARGWEELGNGDLLKEAEAAGTQGTQGDSLICGTAQIAFTLSRVAPPVQPFAP